jgi:hypothetical protein
VTVNKAERRRASGAVPNRPCLECVGHTESIADARFGVHTSVNTAGRRPRRERLVGDGDGHRLAGRSFVFSGGERRFVRPRAVITWVQRTQ